MWNPLIDALFGALPAYRIAALRYNFRGTGRSGGTHDAGTAERLNVEAAFAAGPATTLVVRSTFPDGPPEAACGKTAPET